MRSLVLVYPGKKMFGNLNIFVSHNNQLCKDKLSINIFTKEQSEIRLKSPGDGSLLVAWAAIMLLTKKLLLKYDCCLLEGQTRYGHNYPKVDCEVGGTEVRSVSLS